MLIRFDVKDTLTGQIVKSFANGAAASRYIDRKDAAYGAVRYRRIAVYSETI